MTLPFKDVIVNDSEYSKDNFGNPRFIGYLTKNGEILDYSYPLGIGGHDNNKLTSYFECFFRMPSHNTWVQEFENKNNINIEEEKWYAQNRIEYFKARLEYTTYFNQKYGPKKDPYIKFTNDLDRFFYNCYQADTFMDGFGQNCIALNKTEFYQKYCSTKNIYTKKSEETEEQYHERHNRLFEYDYYWHKKNLILDWYKTVIVQYMQYHLVERCQKGITTSNLKPYETFYNYLLNDFTIHQIPIMIYDSTLKKYIPYEQNQFLVPDSELRLKEEIQAIKKLVPLKERSKYYR